MLGVDRQRTNGAESKPETDPGLSRLTSGRRTREGTPEAAFLWIRREYQC